jgi:hypothetical protein
MISVLVANDTAGKPSVCIVLGQADVFLTVEGTPTSGVALSPELARQVALRILTVAEEIDHGRKQATGK